MKCSIIAKNKEIFCAVVTELTDWGHTYEVLPWISTVHVDGATKGVLLEFLEARHLNMKNLLVVEC